MKTEAEAKKYWCPFARVGKYLSENGGATPIAHTSISANRSRDGSTEGVCKCLASECMAWRWSDGLGMPTRVNPSVLTDHWKGWTVTDPEPDAQGFVGISPPPSQHGFCGLAGKP